MADQRNRKGVVKPITGDVRALVLTGDGDTHAVFLVPESAMSEEQMDLVDSTAVAYCQQVRNKIPTAVRSLRQVRAIIREMNRT